MTPRLSKGASKIIDVRLDFLFDLLKIKLLGPSAVGRRLYVGFTHELSIPGIFERAVAEEGGKVDTTLLDHLLEITADYIDKTRADAKAQAKKRIQDIITDLDNGRLKSKDLDTKLEDELGDIWAGVTANVARVVQTQTQQAQTLGIKSGIDQINTGMGIEDPVVCFIPVKDHLLCDECKRLHLLEDLNTPRAWLSSEVKAGYHKKGDPEPSWSLLHPHCRCALTTILPGFGFQGGRVAWIGDGHDEWAHQRGEKSRFAKSANDVYGEFLGKSTKKGIQTYRAYKNHWAKNHREYQAELDRSYDEGKWLRPESNANRSSDSALYWALTSPEFLSYYESLDRDQQKDLAEKIEKYGFQKHTSYYLNPYHPWVAEHGLGLLGDYVHPKDSGSYVGGAGEAWPMVSESGARKLEGGTKRWETPEEAKAATEKAMVESGQDPKQYDRHWADAWTSRDNGEVTPALVNDEVEAVLDKILPGWQNHPGSTELDPRIVEKFKQGKIRVNVPHYNLVDIVRSGRWRNLYQTGTGMGNTDTDSRLEFETNLGLPETLEELPAGQRPVYGWYDFVSPLLGYEAGAEGVKQYGDVVITLKDNAKDRSTITVGDSSNVSPDEVFLAREGAHAAAHHMAGKHAHHWNNVVRTGRLPDKDVLSDLGVVHYGGLPNYSRPGSDYVEAQIHGGIYPRTDVESVSANKDRMSSFEAARQFAHHFKIPLYDHSGDQPKLVWHPDMEGAETPEDEETIRQKQDDAPEVTPVKQGEPLGKGQTLRGAVLGAALGLAMTPGRTANLPQEHHTPTPLAAAHTPFHKLHPFAQKRVPELTPHLKAISFLETSGGKNQRHDASSHGEHWTAFGPLGFKPAVAHEHYTKRPDIQKEFPGLKDIKDFTPAFKAYPALYNTLALDYWNSLLKTSKNADQAAYRWNQGKYAKLKGWRQADYTRRFHDLFVPVHERVAARDTKVPWLDSLKLSEPDTSWLEPLHKALYWRQLGPMLRDLGWEEDRSTGHRVMKHRSIPGVLPIKSEHMNGEISNWWVGEYARQAGLRAVDNGTRLVPNPAHPFADHYRAMGKLPPADAPPPPPKTWVPTTPHQHVEAAQVTSMVDPTQIMPHKVAAKRAQLATQKWWPSLKVVQMGEGQYAPADDDAEHLYAAAMKEGMGRLPVEVVG